MKKLFLLTIVIGLIGNLGSNAQIPDDTDGRLYRLCKTWGYFKYFSEYQCELQWDTLLNTTVGQVLAAGSNEEFNAALMAMFNKVGNNTGPGSQYPMPDTNLNFDNSWIDDPVFSEPVQDFLETFTAYFSPDTNSCLVKLNDYSVPNYNSYIDFSNDVLPSTMNLLDEASRLTYMFHYWNIINYFFPYKYLMDQPWDSTLLEFIPLFRQASTIPQFHITFLKLVTKINDTHGSTGSTVLTSFFWGGTYMPKIFFTRIDSMCVVAKVDGIPGVNMGDILVELKGIPIAELEDSLKNYIPASTPAALYRDMYSAMIRGQMNSGIEMTLADSNNNIYSIVTIRSLSLGAWYNWSFEISNPAPYYLTTCNYGYVNLSMMTSADVIPMYETLKDAPAIIFDLRRYPNISFFEIVPLLFSEPVCSADYYVPALIFPGEMEQYYYPGWYYMGDDLYNAGSWYNPDAYNGKVYLLVNEETQSNGEYACQYLSLHPNGKVFGTQTAGADGNVSYLTLPGGIITYFTSLGWYYCDGYQQQRNGVKIDTVVSPTVIGIRHGKDEILEAALDCLTGVEEHRAEGGGLSVYPNPAGDRLTVDSWQSAVSGQQSGVKISIVDLYGREVLDIANVTTFPYQIDISKITDGVYILKMMDASGNEGAVKFVKVGDSH